MANDEELMRAQLAGLGDKVLDSAATLDESDAFLAVYQELPDASFQDVYEAGKVITLSTAERIIKARPVALLASGLLIRELISRPRTTATYLLLRGCVYLPDVTQEDYDNFDIIDAIDDEEEQAIGGIENFPKVNFLRTDDEKPFLYLPRHFCRDALVMYSKADSVRGMMSARFQRQTVEEGVEGRAVTVSRPPRVPLTVFIESEPRLMAPLKQLYTRKRWKKVPQLSYPLV